MARSRNIKPGFFINVELGELEPIVRLLFIGLWTIADREGRLKDQPPKIKVQTLPYDDCDISQLLNKLQEKGFILRYQTDGCPIIQIINFKKHQNPHMKEQVSELPAPDMHNKSTIQKPDMYGSSPADSLNLIPDSLNLIPDKTLMSEIFPDTSLEMKMTTYMIEQVIKNYPAARVPDTPVKIHKWCLSFDRIMRIDKRTVEEIREVMKWIYQDDFWCDQIRSPHKLREKWETVCVQMRKKQKKTGEIKQLRPGQKHGESDADFMRRLRAEQGGGN